MMKNKMQNFAEKHPELWKFIKFNITVLVTSALDIGIHLFLIYVAFKKINDVPVADNALLSLLGIKYQGYLYSYLISTTVGYAVMYLMNRKLTFHSDVNPAYSSVLYIILSVCNILISSWIGGVAGSFLVEHSLTSPIMEIVSKFIIINIPTIWTYPIERYVIQIKKRKK